MEAIGSIAWIGGQVIWIAVLIGNMFASYNHPNTTNLLCIAIGLMLIGSRAIDDARHQKSKDK